MPTLVKSVFLELVSERTNSRRWILLLLVFSGLLIGVDTAFASETGGFSGEIADVREASVTVNRGFYARVWDDVNRDGVQDAGEPGLSGIALRLYDGVCGEPSRTLAAADVTDSAGDYIFPYLDAGDYCIVVDEATLPGAYAATTDSSPFDVTLGVDGLALEADFGYVIVYAADRLTVGAYAPCSDISWLEQLAQDHNADFINADFEACDFTLGVAASGMSALQDDVDGDPRVRQSGLDVFTNGAFIPNDPDYNDTQLVYAPQQIDAEGAWDFTRGDQDLIVAVLDTGIDPSHPEFAGRLLPGWDFVNDDADPSDDQGHGTHVAGIIAAGIDNGIGMAGIAGDVKILPVKVLNDTGSGWWSDVSAGITYAADQGAKVINLSLAGEVDSFTLHDAISYAVSKGVTVVAAAGNDSSDTPVYPAAYDEVLALGATTYDGTRWSLSNYGPNVDALAPGGLVWSTYWSADGSASYQFMSGTSMASPHGAGVAALMYSRNSELTPQEVKDTILATATDMGDPGVDALHGAGLINAHAAVAAVPTPDPGGPPPETGLEVEISDDLSGNGIADPGDRLRIITVIVNDSGGDWEQVVVNSTVPEHTTYVEGSTALNAIPVQDNPLMAVALSGMDYVTAFPLDEVEFDIGGLAADASATVSFEVIVDYPPPAFYSIHSETTVQADQETFQFSVDTPVGGTPSTLTLTDASGAPVDFYAENGSIYVSVSDADENTDADSVQTLALPLANISQDDRETVTLTETDADTGIFRGSVLSSTSGGQTHEDGLFFAQSGDALEASYTDADFSPDANVDGAFIESLGSADLQMLKTVSDETPDEGDAIVYTITVKNNGGPNAATHLSVSDKLPAGVTFTSASVTLGSYDESTGLWDVGVLKKDVQETLTIDATVDGGTSGQTITNTASITAADQPDPDPGNNADSADIAVSTVDLWVQNGVSDDRPHKLQTVTYTISVKNRGPAGATGIVVRDNLPADVSFVSVSPAGVYDDSTGLWTVGDLAQGVAATLTIEAQVDADIAAATITNVASVARLDQMDSFPQNDSASVDIEVRQADLIVTKVVDDAAPDEGDFVTYTAVVENLGPDLATGVVLHDELPRGLSLHSTTTSQGVYDKATGLWVVGDLANGASATLTVVAVVDRGTSGGHIINTARVEQLDQQDPYADNDAASVAIDMHTADLQVTTLVDNANPDEGQLITYTILVENWGPAVANDVQVADMLPLGVRFDSASAQQGDYDPATGVWTVGDLAVGVEQALTIDAIVEADTAASTIVNRAGVFNMHQTDANQDNDQDTAIITVSGANLEIDKAVSVEHPHPDDVISYTLTLTNHGPDVATNVRVEDLLPAGVSYDTDDGAGAYDPATGVWQMASLDAGSSVLLHIDVVVDATAYDSVIVNTASITAADQPDSLSDNNQASAQIAVGNADLAVAAAVDKPTPNEGETIVYTIEVTNDGPGEASSAEISFPLPSGVTYVSNDKAGAYNPATGIWQVGDLTPVASLQAQSAQTTTARTSTLNITVQVEQGTAAQNIDATAMVVKSDQSDPSTANNQGGVSLQVLGADLSLTKVVANVFPQVGDNVVYTVTLTNDGPNDATNITVTDDLPARIQFSLATPSAGHYDQSTGLWTLAKLASGASVTLQVQGVLLDGVESTITNIAELTTVDQPDSDSAPNNHAPGEDDYDNAEIYTSASPVVDGKLDEIYDLSPNDERACYVADGKLLGVWHVLAQPADHAVYAVLVIDKDFVDNTYGANIITWPSGHSLGDLAGSDYAQFRGYDANGVQVLDFQIDYISSGFLTPSGYDSLGVVNGDGSHIQAWGTSLAYDLNELGYCAGGDCAALGTDLVSDSPATDDFYTANVTYPDWIYDVVYEVKIDMDAFGAAGFGSVAAPFIHASPGKFGESTIIAAPGVCPGEIGDFVWNDLDGDGQADGVEPGLDGVDINLYRDDGDGAFDPGVDALTSTETTRAGGRYLFQDLQPGTYFVDVVDASAPADMTLSTANDPTPRVAIVSDQSYRDADFGYVLLDFGDASAPSYPTSLAENGARHVLDSVTFLGLSADAEADVHPSHPGASCDDDRDGNDDEDGVVFTSSLGPNRLVGLEVTASAPGLLNAWIDFDRDGDWDESGERVFSDTPLVAGLNTLRFPTPADAVVGTTYARFRFSTQSGLSTSGLAPDGEVEDYQIEIEPTVAAAVGSGSIGDLVWLDIDENGVYDSGEPGMDGIVVQLTNDAGATSMMTTSPGGRYRFVGLSAGVYTLQIDGTTVPDGFVLETSPDPTIVSLPPDGIVDTADFAYAPPPSSYKIEKHLTSHWPARPNETVVFGISISNDGDTWLADLPLQDVYDPAYLEYVSSDPQADDDIDDGALNWQDLTNSLGEDLAPGESFTVTVTFKALKDTTQPWVEPDGATVNTATILSPWADPDHSGPLGAVIPLAEQSYSDSIQIIQPTAVTLIGPEVVAETNGVLVQWQTLSEVNVLSFNLLRVAGRDVCEVVNAEPLLAQYAGADQGATYTLLDEKVRPGTTYDYVLEVVRLDGGAERIDLGAVTTHWRLDLPLIVAK